MRKKMTPEQFDARYQAIRDQKAAGINRVKAKWDQEIAKLFIDSEWTQQEIADHMGMAQSHISQRLRFGRFCGFLITAVIKIPVNLTEWKFREFWSEHADRRVGANTPAETKVFQSIIDSEEWQMQIADRPRINVLELVKEHLLDNRYRSLDEIADDLEIPDDGANRVAQVVQRIKSSHQGGLLVKSKMTAGKVRKFKFAKIKNKEATKVSAITVSEELAPIVEDIARCLKETVPHDAVENIKGQMHRLYSLMKRYS